MRRRRPNTPPTTLLAPISATMSFDIGRLTTFKQAVPWTKPVLIEGGEYLTAEKKTTGPKDSIRLYTRKKAVPRAFPVCVDEHPVAEPKENVRSVKRALPVKTFTPMKHSFFRVSKMRESKGKPVPLSRQDNDDGTSSCELDAAWTAAAKAVLACEGEPQVPVNEEEPTFTQLLAECQCESSGCYIVSLTWSFLWAS